MSAGLAVAESVSDPSEVSPAGMVRVVLAVTTRLVFKLTGVGENQLEAVEIGLASTSHTGRAPVNPIYAFGPLSAVGNDPR